MLNSDVYRKVQREFDLKRQRKIDEANRKKDEIYASNPQLKNIEDEINALALKITRNILNSDEITRQIESENMSMKLKALEEKLDKEFKKIGISKTDLNPQFDCKICEDTGVIKTGDIISVCSCFKQAVINETFKKSNLSKIEEENFATFDIGFYSNKVDKEKYGIDKSPRENIENIKKIAQEFALNIDNDKQKNLLFVGNTGLGKTFLSNAIAKVVIDNSKTVMYQTASVLMDKVIEYKYSYDKEGKQKEQYNEIFDVDLLIIDDLGTETMSNNKFTELFNIINTRLLNNKKIVISTNLTLNELYKQYDERVMSRLIGNFIICKFVGDDIRLKKKRIN